MQNIAQKLFCLMRKRCTKVRKNFFFLKYFLLVKLITGKIFLPSSIPSGNRPKSQFWLWWPLEPDRYDFLNFFYFFYKNYALISIFITKVCFLANADNLTYGNDKNIKNHVFVKFAFKFSKSIKIKESRLNLGEIGLYFNYKKIL